MLSLHKVKWGKITPPRSNTQAARRSTSLSLRIWVQRENPNKRLKILSRCTLVGECILGRGGQTSESGT